MNQLIIVLAVLAVAAVASGVLIPVLDALGANDDRPADRDRRVRDEVTPTV